MLIVLCGYPSSGKTQVSQELAKLFPDSTLITDESMNLEKVEHATDPKKTRGALLSAINKYINKKTVTIADSLFDSKSTRYQAYCIARGVGTTYCVVNCLVSKETARKRNQIIPEDL